MEFPLLILVAHDQSQKMTSHAIRSFQVLYIFLIMFQVLFHCNHGVRAYLT